MNTALITFNAERDLTLSPYFVRFLGNNVNADEQFYLYFREFADTKSLRSLLSTAAKPLTEDSRLFRFWAAEIFRALRDICFCCGYEPVLPIQTHHIEVGEGGLRYADSFAECFSKMCVSTKHETPKAIWKCHCFRMWALCCSVCWASPNTRSAVQSEVWRIAVCCVRCSKLPKSKSNLTVSCELWQKRLFPVS